MQLVPEEAALEKIFAGSNTRYYVPEYQRDYSWTMENIVELWEDIRRSRVSGGQYFMGAAVLSSESLGESQFEIVDGQQRLATFTILLSCLNAIASHFLANQDHEFYSTIDLGDDCHKQAMRLKQIVENMIVVVGEPDHYYLTLNKKDHSVFVDSVQTHDVPLFGEDERICPKNASRIIKCKCKFYDLILMDYAGLDDFFTELCDFALHIRTNLKFLLIKVLSDYDAYLLFESLNSKGLDLSIADLLKNKLLSACDNDDKKSAVLRSWDEMMDYVELSRFSNPAEYLRMYWCAFHSHVSKKELYKHIKTHIDENGNAVALSKDLAKHAAFFAAITKKNLVYPSSNYGDDETRVFAEINTLQYSICYPLFMLANSKGIDYMEELAKRVMNYLFRVISIGEMAVGKADDRMKTAMNRIGQGESQDEVLSCFLTRDSDDGDFEIAFKGKQYNNKLAKYVLCRVHEDRYGSELLPNLNEIHLEHVLPQSYKTNWEDFQTEGQQFEDWIYNIGNCALVNKAINIKISNKEFSDKVSKFKKKDGGAEGTAFEMTYQIHNEYEAGETEWTAERIRNRAEDVSNNITKIWPLND